MLMCMGNEHYQQILIEGLGGMQVISSAAIKQPDTCHFYAYINAEDGSLQVVISKNFQTDGPDARFHFGKFNVNQLLTNTT